MKFKFPLEKVMQHRKMLEDLAQRDFQEAQNHLVEQQEKLRQMQSAAEEARSGAFRRQTEGGKASSALIQVDEFLKGQDIRIERQRERIKKCESLVENLREILREKAIEYKIIEELRDRRFQEFKIERRKIEQKRTDDLNLMRFRKEDSKE
jgi:flagellar FliJ protein